MMATARLISGSEEALLKEKEVEKSSTVMRSKASQKSPTPSRIFGSLDGDELDGIGEL